VNTIVLSDPSQNLPGSTCLIRTYRSVTSVFSARYPCLRAHALASASENAARDRSSVWTTVPVGQRV